MKKLIVFPVIISVAATIVAQDISVNKLPYKMEEMTTPQLKIAIDRSAGTCVIPMGILEKHGPHLPVGTDLILTREVAFRAAEKEYVIIFPPYYFGMIYVGMHQLGAISYSNELIWNLLQETCDELSRNGIKKIILLSGHGGNTEFLQYFCLSQLSKPRDYVVVLFQQGTDPDVSKEINSIKKTKGMDHAGEDETSMFAYVRPDYNNFELAKSESGADLGRTKDLPFGFTGIWWFARFPYQYAGDGSKANRHLGELKVNLEVDQLTKLIRFLKKDNTIKQLQDQFYKQAQNPPEK